MIADDIRELLELDARAATGGADMAVEHCFEVVPPSGPGRLAGSNAEQVRALRQIIEGLGLSVATPDEAREILELKGGDRVAF